ncbi:MAG: ATP-binding protein [Candidimonas sp.]|nr:ATP-binding protein [Candidimonas sp.]
MARVEPTVGYTLLDIVDQRMQTGSLIITSQFPTEHWHSMFNDATLAKAILDRIVHRSHRIGLKGKSLRKQAAKT